MAAIRVLLILVLLAASTSAMSPRRDSMRVEVLNRLGLSGTNGAGIITAALVNSELNINQVEVCTHFPALEKKDSIIADGETEGYALNTDFHRIGWCYRMVGKQVRIPLDTLSEAELFAKRGGVAGSVPDPTDPEEPRYFFTVANDLCFYPNYVPAGTGVRDTFLVRYFAKAPALASDTDTTVLADEYRHYIVYLTVAKLEIVRGNYAAAQTWAQLVPGGLGIVFKEDQGKR